MSESRPDRQQILEMVNGFRPACVIGAAAELEPVDGAGRTSRLAAEQLAEKLHCDRAAARHAVGRRGRLGVGRKAGRVVTAFRRSCAARWSKAARQSVLPMLWHVANILRGWSQLAQTVKEGVPAPRPSSIRGEEADRAAFIAAMHTISGPMADGLVAQLGPPKFRHMLDVGGASGTWTLAFLRAVPAATATIFDLPDAIQQARGRLAGTEFADRVTLAPGDFYVDDLPGGADFAWVSAICHQHSRRHNRELFAKVCEALVPGGRIAIRDVVMEPCRTKPLDGALFAINMLVNTDTGGTFTFEEFAEDLRAAGFEEARLQIKHEAMNSVVVARKS